MARLVPLAVLAALAVLLAPSARAGGPSLLLGAGGESLRSTDLATAKAKAARLRLDGFDTALVASAWSPGLVAPGPEEEALLANADAAATAAGLRLVLRLTTDGPASTPLADDARAQFARYATAVLAAHPVFTDVVVGDEPNAARTWQPQFNPDRTSASAPAYLLLLQTVYDAVKAVTPTVRVWGGALASRGPDRPGGAREGQSPGAFLQAMGAAYRAGGRTVPVMDGLAFHPNPDSSAQSPDTPHPSGSTIALADYDKLVGALATAFDGTAQPGTTLPVLYDAFAIETAAPRGKARLYTGTEPAATRAVSERTQAIFLTRALALAFCQPNVAGLLLSRGEDERSRAGSQSALAYPDGSPKSSLFAVRDALRRVRAGSIRRCDDLQLDVGVTDLRVPTAAEARAGTRTVTFTCSLDCTWRLRVLRGGTTPILSRRGYGLATQRAQVTLPLGALTGSSTVEVTAVAAVNPGPPAVVVGRPGGPG